LDGNERGIYPYRGGNKLKNPMPNFLKYSASAQTLALKKGNFWIGTGDVGKGPTSTTDYWNGISPPSGGYTIYLNKASNGPSIFRPQNSAELISLTNNIAGASYSTAAQCLSYFASQTDKMCFNREYESIVTNGLVLNLDAGFTPSYATTGTTWYDTSPGVFDGTLTNGPTYAAADGGSIQFDGTNDYINLGNQTSLNFTNGVFTAEAWIWIPSSWTAGSQYPNLISKGATAGWDTEGWALFVFRDYSGAGQKSWGCGMRNSGTTNIVHRPNCAVNAWLQIVMTLNGSKITLYENGVEITSSNQTINPGSNSTDVYIGADVNLQCFPGYVSISRLYSRTLSAAEVLQNFNAQKSRYGL
jgi:hypothetical protein